MAGNVAEWVADVYRPRVDDELSDFNYYRGNVYTKNKIGEDGKLVVVDAQSITYDTLSNGRIMARNLPGQLAKVAVDDNETYLRYNFTTADNRNYRDGDRVSSKEYEKLTMDRRSENIDSLTASQRANVSRTMYNSPNQKILSDGQGGLLKVYDRSNDRTTLIDDEARVIKGGSWRDRAYWMDPAQRRYLPQYSATDYIGFRCAMSRVGSKAKKGKTSRG
jgi:gliding motility-associated lipoprotein gldJ